MEQQLLYWKTSLVGALLACLLYSCSGQSDTKPSELDANTEGLAGEGIDNPSALKFKVMVVDPQRLKAILKNNDVIFQHTNLKPERDNPGGSSNAVSRRHKYSLVAFYKNANNQYIKDNSIFIEKAPEQHLPIKIGDDDLVNFGNLILTKTIKLPDNCGDFPYLIFRPKLIDEAIPGITEKYIQYEIFYGNDGLSEPPTKRCEEIFGTKKFVDRIFLNPSPPR